MFGSYLELGIEHILDPQGIDHVLFILVLTVPFLISDWKNVIILATAFTLGHSLTLALSSLDIVSVNSNFVEIVIAFSIGITAIGNFISSAQMSMKVRYFIAGVFGLVHGLGFSNFFKTILGQDEILFPLIAFNLGVEVAQLVVVAVTLFLGWLLVTKLKIKQHYWVGSVSVFVLIFSIKMIVERL